jgi:hypothetical protein
MGRKSKNEVGNVYGRLTVLKETGRKRGAVLFLCKCECGNEKEITGGDLRSGKVHSCGCYKIEKVTNENITHGLNDHRLYSIYHNMISRCYNEKIDTYELYGGRGIKICNEWLNKENGFINFYKWSIQNGYTEFLTLDRMNVNGNYTPDNCRWATNQQQSNNKRSNHYVEMDGEIKTLSEWCEIFNISYKTVQSRLQTGWEEIKAITTPIKTKYKKKGHC